MTPNSILSPRSSVSITRENNIAVLNAFGAEKDPKKRAAIYAKEIRPRLREGDDMPILAANDAGTLSGTLVTQRTLELLKLIFPDLFRHTTDFSDAPGHYGQVITTRIIGVPSVKTYNTTTGYAQSDVTDTDVSITLDSHKYVQITFDANTLSGTVRQLFDEHAPAAAYALAKDMVDSLYAKILAANFTTTPVTQSVATFTRSDVIDLGTKLTLNGAPMGPRNRSLLLYSTYFGQLAKDSGIITLSAFRRPEIIEEAQLPDVHGFSVIDAPNLPGNSENLVGFAHSRSALAIATRLPNDYSAVLPGASHGKVITVTDPDLGLSVMQVQYVNHDLGFAIQRIALMYGVANAQDKAGVRLISA